MEKSKESLKHLIKMVTREMKNETDPHKKQRLNKYRQSLEIRLRDLTRKENM